MRREEDVGCDAMRMWIEDANASKQRKSNKKERCICDVDEKRMEGIEVYACSDEHRKQSEQAQQDEAEGEAWKREKHPKNQL
jgi:hypothetical protein